MTTRIMSINEIVALLGIQANLRSPENDDGGLLKETADRLFREHIDLENPSKYEPRPKITGDMLNQIEAVLQRESSGCDIEINTVTVHKGGWLVWYRASDQSWADLVGFLTKVSDLEGYYKLRWSNIVESEYNAFPV